MRRRSRSGCAGSGVVRNQRVGGLTKAYIKVRGQWTYLYRAVDKHGNTIDFYVSPTRNAKAAKRFLGKALNGLKAWEKPEIINTDKAPTYGIAITELKVEGKCPENVWSAGRLQGLVWARRQVCANVFDL